MENIKFKKFLEKAKKHTKAGVNTPYPCVL